MDWTHANPKHKELTLVESMQIETLMKVAEQLEQLNRNLITLKVWVSGGVNTHAY